MSYILDALKKSEREKALGKIPTLETVVSGAGRQGPKFQISWWVNLLVFLVTLLVILFVMYWLGLISLPSERPKKGVAMSQSFAAPNNSNEKDKTSELKVIQTATELEEDAAQIQENDQQQKIQTAGTTQIKISSQEASAIKGDSVSQTQKLDIDDAVPDKQTKDAGLSDIFSDSIEPELAQEPKTITPDIATQAATKELGTKESTAEAELGLGQSQEPAMPEYSTSLPQALRSIGVNLVSYSSDQLRRFVMLDMTIFKEGDSMKSGVQIIEVQRTGVVVEYKGEKYFLKAS